MLRRRLHLVGRSSASAQSISLLAAQRNQSNNGGGDRLHRYVRDGAGADSPRSAGRGGPSPASSAAPSESMDWAARMQRELMSEVDPLGGLAHKDYYRDPATGYSPQYAPRNFADGGAIAYHHASSSMDFTEATAQRTWRDHDVASMTHHARDARAHSRQLHSSQERQAYVEGEVPSHRFSHALPESTSRRLADLVHNSQVGTAETLHQHSVLNRYQSSPSNQANLSSVIGQHDMAELVHDQMRKRNDDLLAEGLQIEHGVRDKERFDFSVMQRTSRIPFPGYDKDRLAAQHRGSPYGAQQLPPMVSASSVEEAQKNLRSVGPAAAEAEIMKAYARNTVTDTPQMGEGLTESIASQLRLARDARTQEAKSKRDQRFGLGRQGALVQDGGPDRRTQQKNVNDERLVDALRFSSDAYRRTETDEHVNPYVRRNTEKGVGHLLNNSFDIDRREDRLSHGQQDITERNTIHYGTPIQQSIDEFVLTHRNARGERPLDYFKPFPHFRALRLSELYSDTEGFSMMKQRPEFLEWELFTRFRAHHQQRRELALLHGLEPVANETATERERRRQALDELCEKTPFNPSRIHLKEDEVAVGVDTLRNWFGAYFLPSPTIVERVLQPGGTVGLFLQGAKDELGTEDTREHILSSRYLNQLLLLEGYQHRIGRGYVSEVAGRAPEPEIKHAQSPHILRHFDADERAMYEEYVAAETNRQLKRWESITRGRRFIPERKEYGEVVQHGMATPVVDLEHTETSAVLTISAKKYELELRDAMKQRGEFRLDGDVYRVVVGSERVVTPLSVRLESGEVMDITDEIFSSYDLEVAASGEHNHGLNFGVGNYTYNRGNYVETQDVLWEQATAEGTEGWSPATLADGLRPGLPVRARRHLGAGPSSGEASWTQTPNLHEPNAGTSAAAVAPLRVVGDYQHARVVQFQKQPFFNPDPKLLTVEFKADGVVQQVPLSDVLIWQRQTYGPERTVGEESRRYNANGIRRYVDVRHPNGDSTDGEHKEAHFLEKYEVANSTTSAEKYRSTKQITEVDQWTRFDTRRPENYRPIGISHRRDYIRGGYMHRYTPWEWISVQEADQPIIRETIRQDDIGASHVFSLQRYWRYKARPHGYIRNFENEVRDMFQYVDGVTPWKQAQKIRTYWEVREHHPMPQFNRPEVAMHRNTPGLLPAHMWETDKKTGKVKAVKDSVRDYQTKVPLPQWVQM